MTTTNLTTYTHTQASALGHTHTHGMQEVVRGLALSVHVISSHVYLAVDWQKCRMMTIHNGDN